MLTINELYRRAQLSDIAYSLSVGPYSQGGLKSEVQHLAIR